MKGYEVSEKERRAELLRRKWGFSSDNANASLEATRKHLLEMLEGHWEGLKPEQRKYFEGIRREEAQYKIKRDYEKAL